MTITVDASCEAGVEEARRSSGPGGGARSRLREGAHSPYDAWSLRHPAATAEYKRKLEALRVSVEGGDVEDERSD